MARSCDGSNDVLMAAISGIAKPFAMGLLFNSSASTGFFMGLGTDADNRYNLSISPTAGADPVNAQERAAGSNGTATSTTDFTAATWQHALAVFATSTDRRMLLNGANKGTSTADRNAGTPTHVAIGASADGGTPSNFVASLVAEAFIVDLSVWPGATDSLKADAFEAYCAAPLAAGFSPLFIPRGLKHYWPLLGGHTAELDWVGGVHLTVTEATFSAHPPTYRRRRRTFPVLLEAGGGGTILPLLNHYLAG